MNIIDCVTGFCHVRKRKTNTLWPSQYTVGTGHEKMTTLAYHTLFNGSGIHHGNSGIQITHDMFINGYFMLLFDLTPDSAVSERHTSISDNGSISIDVQFDSVVAAAIMCLLYFEYDANIQIDALRNVITDF